MLKKVELTKFNRPPEDEWVNINVYNYEYNFR